MHETFYEVRTTSIKLFSWNNIEKGNILKIFYAIFRINSPLVLHIVRDREVVLHPPHLEELVDKFKK